MENKLKVLACVDQSHFAEYVTDYAAWAAQRMDAPLELLHIMDRHVDYGNAEDHSGIIGLNAQKNLLTELSEQDEQRSREARETARVFLNQLRERAEQAGVDHPDRRLRYGDLENTLAEQQEEARLLVLGRRGTSAETTYRDLGRNVENVVRALAKPILTVTDRFKTPERVLLAYDGSAITRKGVEMVASSPLFKGLPIHVLTTGEKRRPDAEKHLDWAKQKLEQAGFEVTCALIPGDMESVIARYIKEQQIDMLLMGAYTHSPLRSLFFGSKTSDLLRSARIPTLLLR